MTKNSSKKSLDGFIPRRSGSEIGERHDYGRIINASAPTRKELKSEADTVNQSVVGRARPSHTIGRSQERSRANSNDRSDIAASLRELDDEPLTPKRKISRKERRRLKRESRTKAQRIRRRILFIIMWLAIIAIIAVGGWLAYKALNAGSTIFKGNIFDIVQNQPLKEDANGRSNFLVFGTESEGHPGANLTDSIIVLSIDQDKKDAYMVSLPRDLWVEYEMPGGEACTVGLQGKINAQYFCASNDGVNEEAGAKALMNKAQEVTGLEIQYYAHLNWAALIDSINAVGGVDITIPDYDPATPGILDRNFDWVCNFQCYYVNYKDGEQVHMDGEHALAFARARNANGGYGLPRGNFDRELNQQLIIKALREKAVSAGTLTNIGAVTGLIDALGDNLLTNVEAKEVRTLMDLGTKIPSESINSIDLAAEDLVTNGRQGEQSIVRPVAGLMDFTKIQAFIKKQFSSEPYIKEDPIISVLNGSETAGVAQTLATKLEGLGFVVDQIGNAPEGTYGTVEIYQVNTEKTATAAKLEQLYGVKVKTTAPPASVLGTTDFVIIIGDPTVVQ